MERALAEGVQFANLDQLKQACREFAIQNTFEFKTLRSSKTCYEIACKATGCGWRLYARPIDGSNIFSIQKYTAVHECYGLNHTAINKQHPLLLPTKLAKNFNNNEDIYSERPPTRVRCQSHVFH